MRRSRSRPRSWLLLVVLAAVALASAGCVTVRLVGAYDQQIDQSATRLQREMDAFLTKLASLPPGDPDRRYAPNKQFYLDYGVDLRALEIRAASLPKNTLTVNQVQLMESSLEQLRSTHAAQDALSTAALGQYRDLFNTSWRAILTLELAKQR